jgi:protein tyrosine phosphatase (PTP) superfamily phosphohydrolase (DUF442 family)
MGIEDVTIYIRVSDRIASSGQPDDHQFKDIADAKYQVVLNLAMRNSDNAIPEERNIVTAHKMTYVHIPVPFDAPNTDHLRKFTRVMDAFSDQRIWIHCVVNHRLSAFLYQYLRLVQGATEEEVKNVMLPTCEPNAVWQRFIAHEIEEFRYDRVR